MANYQSTLLPDLMARYNEEVQARTELRTGRKPFVMETMQASNILQPELLIEAKESTKRPINANWLLLPTSTSGTARETSHTGPNGDSNTEELVWSELTEKFSFSKAKLDDNLINFDYATAWQFRTAVDKLLTRLESAGITYLEAAKSGVNANNEQLGTWDDALDTFKIAASDISRSPYIGIDNMEQNNYQPMYTVVADNSTYAKYMEIMAQGQANQTNNGWQLFDEFEMMKSNDLTPGTFQGISYWFPKNSIGLLTWIPYANRLGRGDRPESQNGILTTWVDPRYPDLQIAMSMYTTRTDTSGTNGDVQDFVVQVELSFQYCFRKAELSSGTVVQALGQLS